MDFGGAVDGFADALVGTAAADVAAHEIVNVGVGGIGLFGEERGCGHDLAALAIAALRNVNFNPGLLDRVVPIFGEAFDGSDFSAGDGRDGSNAGSGCFPVDVDSTGAAERHAAAKFGAGHVEGVAKYPEERHLRINVYGLGFSVEGKSDGHRTSREVAKLQQHPTPDGFLRKVVLSRQAMAGLRSKTEYSLRSE
jgi:hypothetical protein